MGFNNDSLLWSGSDLQADRQIETTDHSFSCDTVGTEQAHAHLALKGHDFQIVTDS